jgi:hypothetical protein
MPASAIRSSIRSSLNANRLHLLYEERPEVAGLRWPPLIDFPWPLIII